MKPNEDPAHRLLDSLLREQHRNAADEPLLRSIENALNSSAPAAPAAHAAPRRRHLLPPLAAAAAITLSVGAVAYWQARKSPLAQSSQPPSESHSRSAEMDAVPALPSNNSSQLPKKAPLSRYDPLWHNSPLTAKPAAPAGSGNPGQSVSPDAPSTLPSDDLVAKFTSPGSSQGAAEATVDAALAVREKADSFEAGLSLRPGSPAPAPAKRTLLPAENLKRTSADATTQYSDGTVQAGLPPVTAGNRSGDGSVDAAAYGGGVGNGMGKGYGMAANNAPGKLFGSMGGGGGFSRDQYGPLVDQPWKSPWRDALSTFSIDVDAASYTNVRNLLAHGRPVPPDAVRIEECINYFDYRYEGPKGVGPFAVHGTLATCPWKSGHLLARVAIKGREIDAKARPASNLVFLIDVSGSMQDPKKLPLLKRSLRVLLDQLDERDHLGIVVYAGSEGVVLEPTTLDERGLSKAISALEKLEAGGSTNGGAGLQRAYAMASQHIVDGGVNRVILATDGDFNVGTTGQGELVALVKAEAAKGVSLSVLGFGTGNLNDAMLEAITKDGNGNYYYIDGDAEAKRVFLQKLTGTLVTIAKDVKIQVEFNPGKVKAYRLIGYADRILRHEDFSNDKVDAGDIGAGHTVTAFYEIVPQGADAPDTGDVDGLRYQQPAGREAVPSDDWFTLKLRHKHPEGDVSSLIETTVKGEPQAWEQAGSDFRFASAVALFGMKLRQLPEMAALPWSAVEEIAKPALTEDPQEQRAGFIEMVRKLAR